MIGTVAAAPFVAKKLQLQSNDKADVPGRTYHILGVPLRSGSLLPGNENDAQAYRAAHLLPRLREAGCNVVDAGDLVVPSYLPHHSVPPIRNWPGPRIVWDCISDRIAPLLREAEQVPLLIGCDCSVVVGTTQAMVRSSLQDLHVLYIDGDFDDASPRADLCHSAAACATWLLTQQSPFWEGPRPDPSRVSVVGWSRGPSSSPLKMGSVALADIRRSGAVEAARRVLQSIPASAPILLHFDIDVLQKRELPAAYFPHDEGLTLAEVRDLMGVLLKDPRIRLIEISEYAALRDLDQHYVNKLVDLLSEGLRK